MRKFKIEHIEMNHEGKLHPGIYHIITCRETVTRQRFKTYAVTQYANYEHWEEIIDRYPAQMTFEWDGTVFEDGKILNADFPPKNIVVLNNQGINESLFE